MRRATRFFHFGGSLGVLSNGSRSTPSPSPTPTTSTTSSTIPPQQQTAPSATTKTAASPPSSSLSIPPSSSSLQRGARGAGTATRGERGSGMGVTTPNIAPSMLSSSSMLSSGAPAAAGSAAPTTTDVSARRFIVVEANDTPNPECQRFFSMELSFLPTGQSLDFPNEGHSYKSPLAQHLFNVEGVSALYFADEYITVTKHAHAEWDIVALNVKETIAAFAESSENIIADGEEECVTRTDDDTEPQSYDSEIVLALKELIASRIRPMVQADGGNVRYVGFETDDGLVYVMLEGACRTCPSSGMTLKNGIERMLMHWVPEVTEVLEVDEEFAEDFRSQEQQKRMDEANQKQDARANGSEAVATDAK